MATQPLFSESNFRTETHTTDTQPHTQREAFKHFCHAIAQLTPSEFDVISGLVETLHQLANPAPTPSLQDDSHNPKIRQAPYISIGPSGLGGRYQKEF